MKSDINNSTDTIDSILMKLDDKNSIDPSELMIKLEEEKLKKKSKEFVLNKINKESLLEFIKTLKSYTFNDNHMNILIKKAENDAQAQFELGKNSIILNTILNLVYTI